VELEVYPNPWCRRKQTPEPRPTFTLNLPSDLTSSAAYVFNSQSLLSCFFTSHSLIMASGTRLPLKSITFTMALALSVTASRLSIRTILLNTFTGPGSTSRIVATLFVLANLKNIPFAWHVSSSHSPSVPI
jgi:hypothetical protein